MRNLSVSALLLGAAALAAGCEGGKVLEVESTGAVRGVVFLDRNGNGVGPEQLDRPLPAAEVRLVTPGTGAVVAKATADSSGVFRILNVPIGRYEVIVDPARLGDSIRLLAPTPTAAVPPNDTVTVAVGVTYPKLTVEEARTFPAGRRVFVEGTVVAAYADTAHVSGVERSIRATRLQARAGVGDSVRVLGVTSRTRGQPTLDDALVFQLPSRVGAPAPMVVTTGTAATAGGGTLDAAQVQVRATVVDTFNVEGESFLRLNDGSGPVDFFLGFRLNFRGSGFVPGARVLATGVLVPAPGGAGWWIRWRRPEDLRILDP
ncbi:MAG TPA: carboxypeptidase-like regulatory domain-containing protein [Longimicrobiaceae bacterium]|nr:carboxypeptidase-like regulatory domain-containing protein [Longimicrobiaceae bacterium]